MPPTVPKGRCVHALPADHHQRFATEGCSMNHSKRTTLTDTFWWSDDNTRARQSMATC